MANKKNFYIPKIDDNDRNTAYNRNKSSNSPFEKFASSYSGYNVEDKNVFPYVKYNNNGSQYEDLKDKKYQKKYEDYQSSSRNVKDKYSPDRIPSYLRREEPAITRRNIMDLKGERETEKELYQRNRENYVRYSDESLLQSENRKPASNNFNQDDYQINPVQRDMNREYQKPSREERSTLVIRKPKEEQNAFFDSPKPAKPSSPFATSQPNKYSYNNYDNSQRENRDDRYQNNNTYSVNRNDNYENHNSNYRYDDNNINRNVNYENSNSNYRDEDRYSNRQDFAKDESNEDKKIIYVDSRRRNNQEYQNNETFEEKNNYRNNSYNDSNKNNDKLFTTIDDDYEKDEGHFYDDIDIPMQASKREDIQELDSYKMEEKDNSETIVSQKKPSQGRSRKRKYKFPPIDILTRSSQRNVDNGTEVDFQRTTIDSTLEEFKIGGHVVNNIIGPAVTQFEVKLDPGVKVGKIESISRNLQMNLESNSIRIEAPIPGKSTVGIEVPNPVKSVVAFGDLLANKDYLNDGKPLNVILGKKINGEPKYANIAEMPHALVAGRTGSGKTVCIHSIITSILYKATPEQVKLILIDPKRNELMYFDSVPHLAAPIIDDPKLAAPTLKWAVDEMERRYDLFRIARKRTISEYNDYAQKTNDSSVSTLPYIVIVIDEFADLMNTAGDSFETSVQRLTQKARSAGIHMIIATQRPSIDVIKGTIKANIQARIAFSVTTQTDSFTILDHAGAEKLLGKGDMLYTTGGPDIRVQGSYISTDEIEEVVSYISDDNIDYMFTIDDLQSDPEVTQGDDDEIQDELLPKVARHVVTYKKASMNQICRIFNIGYNRADSIMDELEHLGIVSPVIQGRPRSVLVDEEEVERILKNNS